MNTLTTIFASLLLASSIAYNVDTIGDLPPGGGDEAPSVERNEIPPPQPPTDDIAPAFNE